MKDSITYKAKGIVIGNYWGGGKGSYPSKEVTGESPEEVTNKATKMLNDGSLDSGMGYESLIGAILELITTTEKVIEGKTFTNTETELITLGTLSESEEEFLLNQI